MEREEGKCRIQNNKIIVALFVYIFSYLLTETSIAIHGIPIFTYDPVSRYCLEVSRTLPDDVERL